MYLAILWCMGFIIKVMDLEEIVCRAIPHKQKDCHIIKAEKERMRKELTERIQAWHQQQKEKEKAEHE